MGNGEGEAPLKTPKSSTSQEQPPPNSPATVFPDWASFQAYYNSAGTPPIPPPGFFHSSVASSPQGHPYMWGAQHIMPPYGTPPHPYLTMYPHGGLYAHPTMPPGSHPYSAYAMTSPNGTADASVAVTGAAELEGNSADGKNKSPIKRSKGSLGSLNMLTGKGNETGKPSEPSANGAFSHSAESGSDGSSEGSDANSQNGSQQKTQSEHGTLSAEEVQNGNSVFTSSSGVARNASSQAALNQSTSIVAIPQGGVPGPTTNLNIGMDYWGGPGSSPMGSIGGKLPSAQVNQAIVPAGIVGSRENLPSELWMQDEREIKKQRRKQSNRESARRSRLRKQAECEELGRRVETLKEENTTLREELERLREECNKLVAENSYLTERLQKQQGDGTVTDGQTESNNS